MDKTQWRRLEATLVCTAMVLLIVTVFSLEWHNLLVTGSLAFCFSLVYICALRFNEYPGGTS